MDLVVRTKHGVVKGYETKDSIIFRGIPYAETNRFEEPKDIYWHDVFDATGTEIDGYQLASFREENHFYTKEFQVTSKGKRTYTYADSPMTLNIICPKNKDKCPVFVFIHGGAFDVGCVGDLPYGLSEEYSKRGIILVSIGYRLNVFGFYNNMNLGLKDQEFAIKWVYENIHDFGGDKENIVIGGESAGAMSTIDLLLTKRLKGIVKGAIVMSGGAPLPNIVGPKKKEKCEWFWEDVMYQAGCKTLDELKVVEPKRLWEAYYKEKQRGVPLYLQQPGIDGTIIPYAPKECLKRNLSLDVPILLGVTGQDFMPYIIYMLGLKWAEYNAKKNREPIYGYFFDRTPPGESYKAFHAVDLWYAFGCLNQSWRPFNQDDVKVKNELVDYFSNFIKTRNPNGENLPEWNPITKKFKGFRYINNTDDGYIMPKKAKKIHLHVLFKDHGPI